MPICSIEGFETRFLLPPFRSRYWVLQRPSVAQVVCTVVLAGPAGRPCHWGSTGKTQVAQTPRVPYSSVNVSSHDFAGHQLWQFAFHGEPRRLPGACRQAHPRELPLQLAALPDADSASASISPSSIRKPRSLTWKSRRPRCSIVPSGR